MNTTTDTLRPVPSLAETWRRMQLAAGKQAPCLRRSMLFSVLSAVVQGLAFAAFYPLLAAMLATPANLSQAAWWLAFLSLCTAADGVLRWKAREFDYSSALADVTHDLRVSLGKQLRRMPLEELYRKRTGELSAVLAGNVDEVITPMGMISSTFISSIITPAVALIATAFVDWRMALAMLVLVPLATPVYLRRRSNAGQKMRTLAEAHARTSAELIEYAQGLPVLRATGQTGARSTRLRESLEHLRSVQEKAQLRDVKISLLASSVVQIGLVLAMILGVWFILTGSLDVAALTALLVVVARFAEPLAITFNLADAFDYMEAGFEQVEQLLAVPPLPVPTPARKPETFDIHFENVRFCYADTCHPVLGDISFTLPQRSLTALVGPSGSGKTTITRLIMRYGDPQNGAVRIGGTDLRDMEPETIMRHVSVVFQDVYLFDDTILNNIRMGRSDATNAEIETAARAAHCHEFISRLPEGYETRVGDIGGCLSGGERQRISIARAILKNAPIVILDEPTAALDTESEVAVQRAIDTLVQDRTVIVIAHRLSTIVGADTILVLDAGSVVEQGKHQELLKADGRYRAMWNAQGLAKDWHLHSALPQTINREETACPQPTA